MDKRLLTAFWNCGDDNIIQFAITRAHLNAKELMVIRLILDGCMTQEKAAEELHYSVRRVQDFWYSASKKMLNIPWVKAYAKELCGL